MVVVVVLVYFVFLCFFCVSLDHFGFVFSNFVLLAGKNVSEMTYFMSSGT